MGRLNVYLSTPEECCPDAAQDALNYIHSLGHDIKMVRPEKRVRVSGELGYDAMGAIYGRDKRRPSADLLVLARGWMFCPVCVQEYAYAKKSRVKIEIMY